MLDRNLIKKDANGRILSWMNIEELYKEYIQLKKEQKEEQIVDKVENPL